jgi:hypothetical protein
VVGDLALEKKADFERPVHARAKATSVKMVVYAGFTVRTRYVRVGRAKRGYTIGDRRGRGRAGVKKTLVGAREVREGDGFIGKKLDTYQN